MNWIPISEAPKDGTVIDVANHKKRETDMVWDKNLKKWRRGAVVMGDATYFMPIPELPEKP
jgi:hypothetical protein